MREATVRVVQEAPVADDERATTRDRKLNIAVSEEEKDAAAAQAAQYGVDANTFCRQWLRYATGLPSLVGALAEREREP